MAQLSGHKICRHSVAHWGAEGRNLRALCGCLPSGVLSAEVLRSALPWNCIASMNMPMVSNKIDSFPISCRRALFLYRYKSSHRISISHCSPAYVSSKSENIGCPLSSRNVPFSSSCSFQVVAVDAYHKLSWQGSRTRSKPVVICGGKPAKRTPWLSTNYNTGMG